MGSIARIRAFSKSGASSWNDLKDKPFYSETSEIDVVPATDITFGPKYDGDQFVGSGGYVTNTPLIKGQTYTVIWNGQVYECVAKVIPGDYEVYIGNDWLWWGSEDSVDNGVPFAINVYEEEDGIYMAAYYAYDSFAETTVNVCVKTVVETVHELDGKYVKGMGYTETVKDTIMDGFEFKSAVHSRDCYENDTGYIPSPFIPGEHYIVTFNGVEYECVGYEKQSGIMCLGNSRLVDSRTDTNIDLDKPFGIFSRYDGDNMWYTGYRTEVAGRHSFRIRQKVEKTHPIDPKYLPCDLMFKVDCTGTNNPKDNPTGMTKPTIVSGSLKAVVEKLVNGEIPVVKVRYVGSLNASPVYRGEFTCDTLFYNTSAIFCHNIPSGTAKIDVQITMDFDDPNFMEMKYWAYNTKVSPLVIS